MSKLTFIASAPGVGTPGTLDDLLRELQARAVLTDPTANVENSATVTIGTSLPNVADNKRFRIHFLTNSENKLQAIALFSGGVWVRYSAGFQVGQFGYFIDAGAPFGWHKANGSSGTLDFTATDAYDLGGLGQVYLHQFTGI